MHVLLLALVVLAQTAASSQMIAQRQPPPPDDLLVSIALPVHEPDGSLAMETVTMPATGPGVVHMLTKRSVCQPAMSLSEPAEAGVVWRVAVQVVTRTPEQLVASVDWRRIWDGGKKVANGPGGAVQLTLQNGARIPLDFVANTRPVAECRAVGAGLEVRASRGMSPIGGADPATLPAGAMAGGRGALNADLWLLHSAPRDRLATSHQTLRLDRSGGTFTFPAQTVSSERGDVSVEIAGAISRYRTPDGEYLLVSLRRIVSGGGAPPQGFSGSTSSLIQLPPPEEVVSFEMPAVGARERAGGGGGRGGGGGGAIRGGQAPPPVVQVSTLLAGHSFALRMRVTPVPEG